MCFYCLHRTAMQWARSELQILKCFILLQMFKEARRPAWWPLEKWSKDQLDRALHALVKVYTAAQTQWLAMQKAHALR